MSEIKYRIVGGSEIARYALFKYVKVALENRYIDLRSQFAYEYKTISISELKEDELASYTEFVLSAKSKGFNLDNFQNEAWLVY